MVYGYDLVSRSTNYCDLEDLENFKYHWMLLFVFKNGGIKFRPLERILNIYTTKISLVSDDISMEQPRLS